MKMKWMISAAALLMALLLCLSGCGAAQTPADVNNDNDDVIVGDEFSTVSLTDTRAWRVGEKATIGGYTFTAVAVEEVYTLLVCDTSVATRAYNDAYEYAAWEDAEIRTWLNGEFLNGLVADTSFNADLLVTAELETPDNTATWAGECTTVDTVFLLSEQEVREYGDAIPALATDCWLRTAGEQLTHAMVQKADGSLHITGYRSDFPVAGVRPCIRVAANNTITSNVQTLANAQAGGQIAFGTYGGESLVWDVLAVEGGRALIMTDKVIDAVAFNEKNSTSVTYANSDLAEWLNGAFKTEAFSADEAAKIDTTSAVSTPMNPTYATEGGADSAGIFVLSWQEYRMYCTTDGTKLAKPTETAEESGASVDPVMGTSGYWLRTAGKDAEHISYVTYYGNISEDGVWQQTTYLGVRPAMWVTIG